MFITYFRILHNISHDQIQEGEKLLFVFFFFNFCFFFDIFFFKKIKEVNTIFISTIPVEN